MRCASILAVLLLLVTISVASADMTEQEIEAPGPNGALHGTLVSAGDAQQPVVLIIPGSGPTDRDGNNPMGIRASTYRLLAEGLAVQGIPSLRIDKRGMFGSAAAIPDANAVTIRDYADDIHAWIDDLHRRSGAPCIWLLGHSEGGLIALAAAENAPNTCGLILVATPGRPLGEVLRGQLRANPANAPILDAAEHAIDLLEAGQRVDVAGLHPALMALFQPAVQGYLIDAFSYDPAKLLSRYSKPVLIVQGGRDLQIGDADATRLKSTKPDAVLLRVSDANHVLKSVTSDDPVANLATYADPNLPLAGGIVPGIVQFIRQATTPR